jgi:hypothetical protein
VNSHAILDSTLFDHVELPRDQLSVDIGVGIERKSFEIFMEDCIDCQVVGFTIEQGSPAGCVQALRLLEPELSDFYL